MISDETKARWAREDAFSETAELKKDCQSVLMDIEGLVRHSQLSNEDYRYIAKHVKRLRRRFYNLFEGDAKR